MEMLSQNQKRTLYSVSIPLLLSALIFGIGFINITYNTSATASTGIQIGMFAPHTKTLMPVINNHLNSNDKAISFRTTNLNTYQIEKRVLLAQSFTAINHAIIKANSNPKPIQYIGYDNEANNGALSTPYSELVNPAASTNKAAEMVHSAGYKFAATPTRSILLKEYQGVQWAKVDMLVMQLQKITHRPSKFTNIANQVSNYVKGHNPNTLVYVQVNPTLDTISNIVNDINSIRDTIDGVSIVCKTSNGCTPIVLNQLLIALGR